MGVARTGQGRPVLFWKNNRMPSLFLTRPWPVWKGGIRVFLKGEGPEMKQDAHNSSVF